MSAVTSFKDLMSSFMLAELFKGLRITPNVYTTPDEVDLFADRVLHAIRRGMA